jgi:hypothetical protein
MVFVIGHGGLPSPLGQPTSIQLEFAAMGLMLVGLAIGWVNEGIGGLVVLLGLVGFNLVEMTFNGRLARGAFPLFAVPGILFLLSALIAWKRRQQP